LLITIKIRQLFRNFSNGANYARDLVISKWQLRLMILIYWSNIVTVAEDDWNLQDFEIRLIHLPYVLEITLSYFAKKEKVDGIS
jgi:hypothetical protein